MLIGFGYGFWFGEVNSPLMLNSWAGRTWWVFCAGAVVLVMWCCGAVVLVLWCWCCGAGRLGFLVDQFYTHSTVLYLPLSSGVLTPPYMHLMTSCLLAGWLGRPTWSLADILGVSHVDKINTLMIINSIFHFTVTATCITLVAFLFVFSFLCRWQEEWRRKEERFDDQDNLEFSHNLYFLFFFIFLFSSRL